jgi:hypothetical protein
MERTIPGAGELNESKVSVAALSKDRGRIRQRLALFLSGIGLLLLLYVSRQYWQIFAGQEKLALEWQQQNVRPASLLGSDGDALVRLTIARISLGCRARGRHFAQVTQAWSRPHAELGPSRIFRKLGCRRPPGHFLSTSRRVTAGGMRLTFDEG